jgi:hypothetical protein
MPAGKVIKEYNAMFLVNELKETVAALKSNAEEAISRQRRSGPDA